MAGICNTSSSLYCIWFSVQQDMRRVHDFLVTDCPRFGAQSDHRTMQMETWGDYSMLNLRLDPAVVYYCPGGSYIPPFDTHQLACGLAWCFSRLCFGFCNPIPAWYNLLHGWTFPMRFWLFADVDPWPQNSRRSPTARHRVNQQFRTVGLLFFISRRKVFPTDFRNAAAFRPSTTWYLA